MIGPFFVCAALALSAIPAFAQNTARDESPTLVHISASTSLLIIKGIVDGTSRSTWNFETARQNRGAVDFQIGDGASLGISAAFASVPTKYRRFLPDFDADFCEYECEVTADLWSAALNLHLGDKPGFHQVMEGSLGVIRFSNFRENTTNGELGPVKDTDWILSLAYGVGYSAGRRIQVNLVSEVGLSAHSGSGRSASNTDMQPHLSLRLGLRAGIGR